MTAMSRKMLEHDPGEIEVLLPWHAAGTLNAQDARRVAATLAADPLLAKRYDAIKQEMAATVAFNEDLGAPSARAMHRLFAAIDAEPLGGARPVTVRPGRFTRFFASLSPRMLAWSASFGAALLLLQAGLIGAMLAPPQPATLQAAAFQDAAYREAPVARPAEPITRSLVPQTPARQTLAPKTTAYALIRFAPDARASDIAALLDSYRASVVGSSRGGVFRVQFGDGSISKIETDRLMDRLQAEKIVGMALPAH